MTTQASPDLWNLVLYRPHVDAHDLAAAVVQQMQDDEPLDYRTRHLIHDSIDALGAYWGVFRTERWLDACPVADQLRTIHGQLFEDTGFPSLRKRLMDKTDPDTLRQFFEVLGQQVREPSASTSAARSPSSCPSI